LIDKYQRKDSPFVILSEAKNYVIYILYNIFEKITGIEKEKIDEKN
jgi:hypothetical protein